MEKNLWSGLEHTCFSSLIVFLTKRSVSFLTILFTLSLLAHENLWWISCLKSTFMLCNRIICTRNKTMNKRLSLKKRVSLPVVGPIEKRKSELTYIWSGDGQFNQKLTNSTDLSSLPETLWCYPKGELKLWVSSVRIFWIYWFHCKTTVYCNCYSLHDACEEIGKSTEFLDF